MQIVFIDLYHLIPIYIYAQLTVTIRSSFTEIKMYLNATTKNEDASLFVDRK